MTKIPSASKNAVSLKHGYRWRLFAVLAANLIVLYAAVTYDVIRLDGISAVTSDWQAAWKNIGSVAVAFAITTILNGLLSSDAKARLIFWRWRNPLPGCRAFSHYLTRDPRIDFGALERALGTLPTEPAAQNALWYQRIYKIVQNDPVVLQVHKDFLFSRDYTALSLLFLVFLGAAGAYAIAAPKTMWIYLALLAAQLVATMIAARNYGTRLVTTSVATWQKGI
jgi:hypothetical protein